MRVGEITSKDRERERGCESWGMWGVRRRLLRATVDANVLVVLSTILEIMNAFASQLSLKTSPSLRSSVMSPQIIPLWRYYSTFRLAYLMYGTTLEEIDGQYRFDHWQCHVDATMHYVICQELLLKCGRLYLENREFRT